MALRKSLILRKLRSSCLEGRTALIQPIVNFLTASDAGFRLSRAASCPMQPFSPDVSGKTRFGAQKWALSHPKLAEYQRLGYDFPSRSTAEFWDVGSGWALEFGCAHRG